MEKNEIILTYRNLLSSLYEEQNKYNNLHVTPLFLFSPPEFNMMALDKKRTYAMDLITEFIIGENKKLLLPYDKFIIDIGQVTMDINDKSDLSKLGIDTAIYIVHNFNEIQIFQILKPIPYIHQIPIIAAEIIIGINDLYEFLMDRYNKRFLLKFSFFIAFQGKNFICATESDLIQPIFQHLGEWIQGTTMYYLFYFLEYLNTPSNYIVQKFPPKYKNNSTEFILSQSHFLVINKNVIKKATNGGISHFDRDVSKKFITSHQRRGYLRRYRHDRFRSMKGRIGYVKPAWIGPKEWFGTDKKIYRVIV